MLYFSYGSNMSSRRLQQRIDACRFVTTASLHGHELRFHKAGRDGSAKCDAYETGHDHHHVLGVIFDISRHAKVVLDRYEGLGQGYAEKTVSLLTQTGERVDAVTYYATHIDTALKPYHWYREHVLAGAREHRLPQAYIADILATACVHDNNNDRHSNEIAIYRDLPQQHD